jgi:hypothetical protein
MQLPATEETPNGEVGAMDLGQLQKEKQDLEQQLTEKNKVRVPFVLCVPPTSRPSAWKNPVPFQRVLLRPGTSW